MTDESQPSSPVPQESTTFTPTMDHAQMIDIRSIQKPADEITTTVTPAIVEKPVDQIREVQEMPTVSSVDTSLQSPVSSPEQVSQANITTQTLPRTQEMPQVPPQTSTEQPLTGWRGFLKKRFGF